MCYENNTNNKKAPILAMFLCIMLLLLLVTACSSDPVNPQNQEEYTKELSRWGDLSSVAGMLDSIEQNNDEVEGSPQKVNATLTLDQTLFDSEQHIEATIELINVGPDIIYYGGDYVIEQWEDGQWYTLTFKEALNFTSQLYRSQSGERFQQQLYVPAQLTEGKYRIVKIVETSDGSAESESLETVPLAMEFEVQ